MSSLGTVWFRIYLILDLICAVLECCRSVSHPFIKLNQIFRTRFLPTVSCFWRLVIVKNGLHALVELGHYMVFSQLFHGGSCALRQCTPLVLKAAFRVCQKHLSLYKVYHSNIFKHISSVLFWTQDRGLICIGWRFIHLWVPEIRCTSLLVSSESSIAGEVQLRLIHKFQLAI